MRRLVVVLAFAASCVPPTMAPPVAEHALTGAPRQAFTGGVKVIMDGAPLEHPYEEVAIVTARGWGLAATLPEIIAALREETRQVGGNAVIRVRYDHGSGGASATGVAVWMEGLPALPAPPAPPETDRSLPQGNGGLDTFGGALQVR